MDDKYIPIIKRALERAIMIEKVGCDVRGFGTDTTDYLKKSISEYNEVLEYLNSNQK